MKKFIALVVVLCAVMISSTASAASIKGVVAYYNDSSDKIIIETNMGFTCGEVMGGGYFLDKGHVVVGSLESYGTHEIYDLTSDRSFRLYIDEYWLSAERALEWLGR